MINSTYWIDEFNRLRQLRDPEKKAELDAMSFKKTAMLLAIAKDGRRCLVCGSAMYPDYDYNYDRLDICGECEREVTREELSRLGESEETNAPEQTDINSASDLNRSAQSAAEQMRRLIPGDPEPLPEER